MERTKGTEEKRTWRKEGGGTFRMGNGKIIKPKQIFKAYESEIPKGFRDIVIAVGDLPEKEQEKIRNVNAPVFSLVHRGGGWFNVTSSEGKIMNDKALKKDEAEKLIEALTG